MTDKMTICHTSNGMATKSKHPSTSLSHFFTTVTPLSKTIAFFLFIFLPVAAFFLGVTYGKMLGAIQLQIPIETHTQYQTGY